MSVRSWTWRWGLMLLLSAALLAVAADADDAGDKERPQDVPETPPQKIEVVPNVGGHTGAIADMAFDSTGSHLYTVGKGEVAEWNVKNGRRLRVWRVPGFPYRLAV